MKCYVVETGPRDSEYILHVFSTLEKAQKFVDDVCLGYTKYPWRCRNWMEGRWHYEQIIPPSKPYYNAETEFEIYELDYD